MSISRYINSVKIGGIRYGTSEISTIVKQAVNERRIGFTTYVVKEGDRLDTIAFHSDELMHLGDSHSLEEDLKYKRTSKVIPFE